MTTVLFFHRRMCHVCLLGAAVFTFIFILRILIYNFKDLQNDSGVSDIGRQRKNREETYFAKIDSSQHENCKKFLSILPNYDGSSKYTHKTSLAFTIVTHKDVLQFARLLRMIHRPANFYCVHIDGRSPYAYEKAILGVVQCFGNNVHVVPRPQRINVNWGDETVLLPHLICAQMALQHNSNWTYLINLTGQEFPLRTDRELTAIAEALNNSVLVEAYISLHSVSRAKFVRLPFRAQWYKGSLYGMYPRGFLEFILTNREKAQPILKLMTKAGKIRHPDEFLFNTFAYNPHLGAPGACLVPHLPSELHGAYLGRYVKWNFLHEPPCTTLITRGVCILGLPHVEELKMAPHLVANKFYADFQPEAYDQMEQWYFAKWNREEATNSYNKTYFDPYVYSQLSCTKNHI